MIVRRLLPVTVHVLQGDAETVQCELNCDGWCVQGTGLLECGACSFVFKPYWWNALLLP